MQPSRLNSPSPRLPRSPLWSNLLLLGSLAILFACFWTIRKHGAQYEAIKEEGSKALTAKDMAGAKNVFEKSLHTHPDDPQSYLIISDTYLKFDQPALAVEYAQRGVDACKNAPKPQLAELYVQLAAAQSLAEPTHPQMKAIDSARTALRLDPDSADLKNALGYMLADNDQNLDEAEKLIRQALQSLKPRGDDPFSDLIRSTVEDSFGWLLYKKGDYVGAVAALTQATQDLPSETPSFSAKSYYYHLGAAYRKAGQMDAARQTLDIALQYDPAFPEAKAEEALLPPQNIPAATPAPVVSPPAPSSTSSLAPPVPSSGSAPPATPGLKL